VYVLVAFVVWVREKDAKVALVMVMKPWYWQNAKVRKGREKGVQLLDQEVSTVITVLFNINGWYGGWCWRLFKVVAAREC
jgi:hypothetical protein